MIGKKFVETENVDAPLIGLFLENVLDKVSEKYTSKDLQALGKKISKMVLDK